MVQTNNPAAVGGTPAAARSVGHHRRAAVGGLAILADPDVLDGNLESRTLCRPAQIVFSAEIRGAESQMAGHSRPARGFAEHAALNLHPDRLGKQELQASHLHVLNLILRPLAARGHLYQLGIELAEHRHQIALRGHHFADVFVGHRHFVEAGGNQASRRARAGTGSRPSS